MNEKIVNRTEDIQNLKLYTISELMPILGVSRRTMMRYIDSGKVPAKKICGKWRVKEADLKALINGE